jgi:hypothetical protein
MLIQPFPKLENIRSIAMPMPRFSDLIMANVIERVNKALKRRAEPMEIVVPTKSGLHAPGFRLP